jgi:hypothetical protein
MMRRLLALVLLLLSFVARAVDIGYQSPSGDDNEHLLVMRCNEVTMTEDAEAGVTVTWRIADDANTAGDQVKSGIFDATGATLLAESTVRTDITTQGEYTFSGGGFTTFDPANATTYLLCILASDASVYVVFDNVASPSGLWVQDDNFSTFSPLAFTGTPTANDAKSAIGFMTYTPAAGGGGSSVPVKFRHFRQMKQ